ncbi:MAG: hypothetical protein KDA27_21140 [Candidatus Eisenbacteria bacterium]|uniref:Uncharacterized protein n=1 Tax=Eiseniibacteriota bacterium TaxID=2212470 RepID=A0A956SG88_UNCEI|nr:hypothetical protein [Candidatus Eisenbacteria bacterium]
MRKPIVRYGRRRFARFSPLLLLVLSLTTLVFLQVTSSGCSSRSETPTLTADSTLIRAAKEPGGIEASITFCGKSETKSGRRRAVSDVFTADDDAKVYAYVDLENQSGLGDRPLDVHLVWIGPDESSFFTKRIEYTPSDSASTLSSRISLPADRRDPGSYSLRVYVFRELIAERAFEVLHTS